MRNNKLFWRTDEQIRAASLRVIDSEGKLIGVLNRADALAKAKEQELTLVEIAPNANPPVAKIVDFGKFRYAEEKKLREISKKNKGGELKEIRFSPFIADNDYKTRFDRILEFLGDKNKVKIVVVFKGPQMRVKNQGYILVDKIVKQLGDRIVVDMQPKFLGKHLITIVSPIFKKKQENAKN